MICEIEEGEGGAFWVRSDHPGFLWALERHIPMKSKYENKPIRIWDAERGAWWIAGGQWYRSVVEADRKVWEKE